VIRQESIRLEPPGADAGANHFAATIVFHAFAGQAHHYVVQLANGRELEVAAPGAALPLARGARTFVAWRPRRRGPAPRRRAGPGWRTVRPGSGWWLLVPALLLLLAAFVLPVGMMVPMSFRPYVPLVGITDGFTVRYYTRLLTDSYYLEIIGRTLALGFTVTLSTLVIGYPVAFFLARTRSRWRNWLTILIVFPLMLEPGRAHLRAGSPCSPRTGW